jgi:transposase
MTKKHTSSAPLAKPRAVFSDQFKRQAVARLRSRTQPATDLALELGIRRNQLYKWAKQIDALPENAVLKSPGRPPESEESEVVKLRRELDQAKEELEILKKFDAYLTRPGK